MTGWVRACLVVIGLGWIVVFVLAGCVLKPYRATGEPLLLGTHEQLGLPPCSFYRLTGIPCPSCGMTSSMALFMHGDPANSLRANPAGTLLAVAGLVLVPWFLLSGLSGRRLGLPNLETMLLVGLVLLTAAMLLWWGTSLVWRWFTMGSPRYRSGLAHGCSTLCLDRPGRRPRVAGDSQLTYWGAEKDARTIPLPLDRLQPAGAMPDRLQCPGTFLLRRRDAGDGQSHPPTLSVSRRAPPHLGGDDQRFGHPGGCRTYRARIERKSGASFVRALVCRAQIQRDPGDQS
ncbi:MAG: hypothetical protein C4297_07940 [Gemmataceae bacterium]